MDVFCWYNIGNKFVQLSILLMIVTACVLGIQSDIKVNTPTDIEKISFDGDRVSPMIVAYTMLKTMGKNAKFESTEGNLHLISDDGIYSLYVYRDISDGDVCDPYTLYEFSDIYANLPYRTNSILQMFEHRIKDEDLFIDYIDELSIDRDFTKNINKIVELIEHDGHEYDSLVSTMTRIIGKIRLINFAQQIFNHYPCTE